MDDAILIGLLLSCAIGVCAMIGFMLASQARGIRIQADILHCLSDLIQITHLGQRNSIRAKIIPMDADQWRDLPPDAQLAVRTALLKVLQDMDRELPARN